MGRKTIYKLLFLVGILSLFGSAAFVVAAYSQHGKVYYLDAINGNDNHSGLSPQKAWKSLDKVNQFVFNSGDSLLLHRGTSYNGQLKPTLKTVKGRDFVVSAFGTGNAPVINGGGVMPAAVYLFNLENIKIQNIHITNQAAERKAGMAGILVEIKNYGTARNISLQNLTIEDVNGSLVKKSGGGSGILVKNGGDSIISTFNGLTIEGCTIRRCERNAIIFGAYWSRHNWHPNLNVVVRNNLIEEVPGDGIVPIGCDGALIEGNIMRNCTRLLPQGEAAAGIWPWSCDNTTIQYNEVSDHKAPWDAQGFDSDWNCQNTIIQYNYSHNNEGGFVLVCNDGSVGSKYNIGNTGTIIRYNVSINDGARKHKTHAGEFSPVIHFAGPTTETRFYNNLIIHKGAVIDTTDNSFMKFTDWGGMPVSAHFANNMFVTLTPSAVDLARVRATFDYNLFYGDFNFQPLGNGNQFGSAHPFFWIDDFANIAGFSFLKSIQQHLPEKVRGIAVENNASHDFFHHPIQNDCWIGIDQNVNSTPN